MTKGRLKTLQPRLNTLPSRLASLRTSLPFGDAERGTRHQRGYGWAWEQARLRVLRRDAGLCQPCIRQGVTSPGCNTVDHIVPRAEGGSEDDSNLQTICKPCHQAKTAEEAARARGRGGLKV